MFKVTIMLGNAAMSSPADVAKALRNLAGKVAKLSAHLPDSGKIMDENGNSVGRWSYEPTSE